MKHLNRKIKGALLILVILLMTFIGFSKAGILFSVGSGDVITVSTTKKTFDPNKYVASVSSVATTVPTTTTIVTTTTQVTTNTTIATTTSESNWDGEVLTKRKGVVMGPSGKESYYNLNMTKVINTMRRAGYSEEEYPYWVREDGVKMFGNYVIVAADFNTRPRGTILESSLGTAIVCDTGSFAKTNPTQIDVAVSW